MKKIMKKLIRKEKGQALPMVLILMVLGGLIVAPLVSYTTSGLKVSQAYERMADEFYAADAGVEDGVWQIKYEHLDNLFVNYERFDYDTEYGPYNVDVNNIDVEVEIENIWIPDIDEPADLDEANRLAETDKLIIAGCVSAELTQQVKIHYKQEEGDPDLFVTSIGVWLPPGFSYDELGECTLEAHLNENFPDVEYTRETYPHKGGEAVVWTFTEPAPFTAFPGVSEMDIPMTCSFTFNFEREDPASQRNPEAVSWLTTSGVADFPYSWDADVRVFHINSVANGEDGTTIDAYAIKSDPRQLVSGVEGDYRAIGNTLMLNLTPDWFGPVRDTMLDDSDATVDDIPTNAYVKSALLYWSAWIIADEEELTVFIDPCQDIWDKWIPGSDWEDYWWYGTQAYRAHHYYGGNPELVLEEPVELGIYESGMVTVSLDYWKGGQLESGDCLQYAFYDGSVWSNWHEVFCDDGYGGASNTSQNFEVIVPDQYLTANFKMKFRIEGFDTGGMGGTEYCYIDNIKITAKLETGTVADTEIRFEIDGEQVYLAEDENEELTIPTQGVGDIVALEVKVEETTATGEENDYSYCCRADVTPLVQAFADHGNAVYTVGDVDGTLDSQWSYAGWSLVIIYYSPETQRHYLYMSDINEFRYIAPWGSGLSFPISGFLVPDPIEGETIAATITCFLGDGDDYYSGDFIAINAPEGLQGDQIPNSYKLWDGITLYAEWSWPEPEMDNVEGSPNNVWNGRSEGFGGSFIDGVDIDTFYVPWGDPPSDGLLKPGDSSATVTLNFAGPEDTTAELLNFIYIIIAFRSETVTGGTVSYLIEG